MATLKIDTPSNDLPTHLWAQELRQAACQRLTALELPSRKNEAWRYTDLRSLGDFTLDDQASPTTESPDLSAYSSTDQPAARLVFVNGHFSEALSNLSELPNGVTLAPLAQWAQTGNNQILAQKHMGRLDEACDSPFITLNSAMLREGIGLDLDKGALLENPIEVLFVSDYGKQTTDSTLPMTNPRIVVHAAEQSQATLIEHYISLGDQPALTNSVTQIIAMDGASVDHYRILDENDSTYHVSNVALELASHANVSTQAFCFGGGVVRNEIKAALEGEDIDCTLNGIVIGNGSQHIDNHTLIEHIKPHCRSFETYKNILSDQSTGVFNGKIFVHPQAQKTDAKQNSNSLLLSPKASMNGKPELEIYADDVRCTHGATIGQLNNEALFYMQSRGIPVDEAKRLLTVAFVGDVIDAIGHETLKQYVSHRLDRALNAQR